MFLLFQNALHTNFTHHFLKGVQTKPNNTFKKQTVIAVGSRSIDNNPLDKIFLVKPTAVK